VGFSSRVDRAILAYSLGVLHTRITPRRAFPVQIGIDILVSMPFT